MCRSVPQMPARRTRISTSLMPMVGSGTSSSHSPGSDLLLTSAFIRWKRARRSPYSGTSEVELGGELHQAREVVLSFRQLPERRTRETRVRRIADRRVGQVE